MSACRRSAAPATPARPAAPRRLGRVRARARPTSSAARRPSACACRAGRGVDEVAAALRPRRRAARPSRPSSTRRRRPRRGGARPSRSRNPVTRYRWLLAGGDVGYAWLNGARLVAATTSPDADDFVLASSPAGPDWHLGSVVYEIFPDRFATSGLASSAPAVGRAARVGRAADRARAATTPFEWYGGDLARDRGAPRPRRAARRERCIYLTPIFPAGSTHRYDATTFDRVDPLLGGDEALASLARAAHARGHPGDRRPDARTTPARGTSGSSARRRPARPSAASSSSTRRCRTATRRGTACRSLPKLNWRLGRAARAAARRSRAAGSTLGLDGWRIDVANMAGRYRDVDLNARGRRARSASVARARATLLVAEHGHDFRADLRGGGWHGGDELRRLPAAGRGRGCAATIRRTSAEHFWGTPVGLPTPRRRATRSTSMRAFRAGVPWEAVLHSWTLLDSHDTARFRTVVGLARAAARRRRAADDDARRADGLRRRRARARGRLGRGRAPDDAVGRAGQLGRRRSSTTYRRLIALRRSSDALARGGIRYAHVDADAIAYLRETRDERLLCLATPRPDTSRSGCRSQRSAARARDALRRRRRVANGDGRPARRRLPRSTSGG